MLLTVTNLASAWGVPAVLSFTEPSKAGIPYRWQVTMGDHSYTEFQNYVGAISWWQVPPNTAPLSGWTHTSNWVDLELQNVAYVEIDVEAVSGSDRSLGG